MKVLLALSLLLFLNSVFSQGKITPKITPCPSFGQCPKGYLPQFSGRNVLHAECYCKQIPKTTPCEQSASACMNYTDKTCYSIESICSPKEIVDICNEYFFPISDICDRANQKLIKENYAEDQRTCAFYRDKCNRMLGDHCLDAASYCDPETTVQLCKNKRINNNSICERAEIGQEKNRAGYTKYSCDNAQVFCLTNQTFNECSTITKFCDAETAAKWCYKDDTNQKDKISDKDCSEVVKKSQYLMFGKSKPECWEQVPLCEGGNSEACTLVATYCVKEVTSALCNAKKITSKRICKYAGLEGTTSSSYPGCDFFNTKCRSWEEEYCPLASHYCDAKTIRFLCYAGKITDSSICEKAEGGNSDSFDIHIPIVGGTVKLPGGLGLGLGL